MSVCRTLRLAATAATAAATAATAATTAARAAGAGRGSVTAASRRAAATAGLGRVERSARDIAVGDDTENRDVHEQGNVGRLECDCYADNRSACDQELLAKRTEPGR